MEIKTPSEVLVMISFTNKMPPVCGRGEEWQETAFLSQPILLPSRRLKSVLQEQRFEPQGNPREA